ncbi:uncharacterized protein LOC142233665 [Haematobia irritans]|uniref:uncharacterized protein LOC142233665 n=1 Tax=Haematobia irritans TaxID=7368 RepID=UPI003F4F9B44
MRAFILLCFVATACAQYNYGSGVSGGGSSGSSGSSGVSGGHSSGGRSSGGGGYNTEFYTFVAPEGAFDDPHAAEQFAASIKKNVRVIFIKNPENKGLEDAVLNLAKNAASQKTAIYVLNKQHDLGELASKFNAIRNDANAKPEVHFVKYRTPEDAANAQRAIQGQYDSLGGKSQNFNGGVAPVLNFASQAQRQSHQGGSSQGASFGGQSPQPVYLPSSVFRKFRTIRRS